MKASGLSNLLEERFGVVPPSPPLNGAAFLQLLASHRVHRSYLEDAVPSELVDLLCACALSSPSKSDLQQRDIVIVEDAAVRASIADRLPHMPWTREAPAFLVFCVNGRRLPQISQWKEKPFPNDHFDLLFNGIGDAAIALAWFLIAAEAVGLCGCPISEIRNFSDDISDWLDLPQQVVPFAGLCLGWPSREGKISPRLPLEVTVHRDRFTEDGLRERIAAYDRRREKLQPYGEQKNADRWGAVKEYGWSEQKARQYADPQRTDFADFVRRKGFSFA